MPLHSKINKNEHPLQLILTKLHFYEQVWCPTQFVHFLVKCYNFISPKGKDWLAQLGERWSTEREVAGSNPGRTNTQGL